MLYYEMDKIVTLILKINIISNTLLHYTKILILIHHTSISITTSNYTLPHILPHSTTMAKRRKISESAINTENKNSDIQHHPDNDDDEEEEENVYRFSSMEDFEQARIQMAARFQKGETMLEEKCRALSETAESLETSLRSKLRVKMMTSLSNTIKKMTMGQFLSQYSEGTKDLHLLLSGGGSRSSTGSQDVLSTTSSSSSVMDAPLGRYGTIKTPAPKRKKNPVVAQTPMHQGTSASQANQGMFSVMKGPNGEVTVQLPNGQALTGGAAAMSDKEKEEGIQTLLDAQNQIAMMLQQLQ